MNRNSFSLFFSRSNIPNVITGSRIILFLLTLFAINYTYHTNEPLHAAFSIIGAVLYGLDWLDGYVARKYGWESSFGAIFDPAGDKICAYSMLAYFYSIGIFPLWALAIILFRDIVLSTIRLASVKYGFTFKTSQMGKLRTNIIGFGGGMLYLLHYWGEYYFIEVDIGISHVVMIGITLFTIFNIVKLPNQFMLKIFPRFTDKVGAVITFIIAAIYPPYSIIIAMIWITAYTLWDYGRAFMHEVEKKLAVDRKNVQKFIPKAIAYCCIGIGMTAVILGLLTVSIYASILIAMGIFIALLMQNQNVANAQLVTIPHKQTTTSNTS
ncbi:hypothetical protein GF369_03740 [Candidatus Peregrinibacteria bacterium]|nr:hypothetical protein [Candidatus Peregrinibacteria bacterium]